MSETTITAALRQAADLLEAHPDLPDPYITTKVNGTADLNWFLHGRMGYDEQKATAARIVRAIDGTWNKSTDSPLGFSFTQHRGALYLFISVEREAVCQRVVVGTETVTVPARPAEPERVEEREKVEWRCEPLLADASTPLLPMGGAA